MHSWDHLNNSLQPLRQRLLEHSVYGKIRDVAAVRTFMEHHVYAVWDFMSLLKALQQRLCCVTIPWLPPSNPFAARLINEIVLAEETDVARDGAPASHFDLYLDSMREAGADVGPILGLCEFLRTGQPLSDALTRCGAPPAAKDFVEQTFQILQTGQLPAIAAAFTCGREDLLPGLFSRIIQQLNGGMNGSFDSFVYYLDRHVALDGDEHGPQARKLMIQLCGDQPDAWAQAESAAIASLESRLALWNAMSAGI
ncbi:hypothetical protein Pan44_21880 [Caulifigura coniformis]|uniref:DUF3050 domain-containing protein n=1 Tax=Caulifigura coniformis TaxID=2527983 RepID=A0A517SDG8_9PLAN|nr:DUF3050 domain-containing protein [Caulifigura coniformis]QDT54161.1 hypothetical protein Pan44_21880 [Caulifigura coniformis]